MNLAHATNAQAHHGDFGVKASTSSNIKQQEKAVDVALLLDKHLRMWGFPPKRMLLGLQGAIGGSTFERTRTITSKRICKATYFRRGRLRRSALGSISSDGSSLTSGVALLDIPCAQICRGTSQHRQANQAPLLNDSTRNSEQHAANGAQHTVVPTVPEKNTTRVPRKG